jgi:hypothetical protein
MSQDRGDQEELGDHESRHVDQWAVANLVAGPFAFLAAYFLGDALHPGSHNHFEWDTSLSRAGYPPVPENWTAPRLPDLPLSSG